MLSYQQALERIAGLPRLTGIDRLPLESCLGRQLATAITAKVASPVFTNSAMDGFALRYADVAQGDLTLDRTLLAGRVAASDHTPPPPRHCVRIMTGAMLPAWADTVVPVERAVVDASGKQVRLLTSPVRGANIRVQAEDIAPGTTILAAGTHLNPERLMLAAALGHAELPVLARPDIVIVTTGDELVAPGAALAPGWVYDSNQVYLTAAVRQAQLTVTHSLQLADDVTAATQLLNRLEQNARPTLLLTSGAVSAGELDFIPQLAVSLGFVVCFHRVAIRPGRPIFLAVKGAVVWLGLPGNPLAACAGWNYFARPVLHAVAGLPVPAKRWVRLEHSVDKPAALRCFYRAVVTGDTVRLSPGQGSAHLAASQANNAYVELPEGIAHIPAATLVEAMSV